ncbi:PREDICTED: uncharacterized protein LOC105825208 [Propithecus coquereli]|uniref:uncharacterized protein LOC105825208 n=1 Tax=Propithecus coquereli TaxID=379532 RepID=UPI00063F8D68|nr:PREDICTED: uncharacterized protein LOC105825208 [Propithecus coquereli]
MAGQLQQQQMKTSFLFIQLRAPPAPAVPAQSPATAACTAAAPGGLEEGHILPSPRTGFLAGWDLRRTQGLAVSPSSPPREAGPGTERPAAFGCSALKAEKAGEANPQDPRVSRGGVCGSPHRRRPPAPACRKLGRPQPLPCGCPSPAPGMSNGSGDPSTGWKHQPVPSAPQDPWGMDPLCRGVWGCSIPRAALDHAAEDREPAVLRTGAATCQVLPRRCEEDTGTSVRATRARLYRYCPAVQISTGCPASPAALPLKVRTSLNPPDRSRPTRRKGPKAQTCRHGPGSPLCLAGPHLV